MEIATAFVKIVGKEIIIKDYVKVFYNKCALRPSCHKCPYTNIERKIDMTIGDFWHIEEKLPDFYDSKGNSLFLIHTNRGIELFNKIRKNIECKVSNTEECWQINLEKPTTSSPKRQDFWKDYHKQGIEIIMKKCGRDSFEQKIKNKLKEIFGGGLIG